MRSIESVGGIAQAALGPSGTPIVHSIERFADAVGLTWTLTDDAGADEVEVTATIAGGPAGIPGNPGPLGNPGPIGNPGPAGGPGSTGTGLSTFSSFVKLGTIASSPARLGSVTGNVGAGAWKMFMWCQSYLAAGNLQGSANDWIDIYNVSWNGAGQLTLYYQTFDPGGLSDVVINPAIQAFG